MAAAILGALTAFDNETQEIDSCEVNTIEGELTEHHCHEEKFNMFFKAVNKSQDCCTLMMMWT